MIIHVRVSCVKGSVSDDWKGENTHFAEPDNAQIMEEEV
jgi:hypothetical protein